MANTECCPKFQPDRWNNKILEWQDKTFIKEEMPTFFHIPLPGVIGKKVEKMMQQAIKSDQMEEDMLDALLLFHDPGLFKSQLYMSVKDEVPGADNQKISGTFEVRVFTGKYTEVPKFMKVVSKELKSAGKDVKGFYVHYAYCPKCAKKFGENFITVFAKVV